MVKMGLGPIAFMSIVGFFSGRNYRLFITIFIKIDYFTYDVNGLLGLVINPPYIFANYTEAEQMIPLKTR